jgi:Xaa-Pro aminopeptidase
VQTEIDCGTMAVDWEERVDFRRLRQQRLEKAQAAIAGSDLDFMISLRLEDVRYLTAFRHHLGPVVALGWAATVLAKDGSIVLYVMDDDYCRERMPWLDHSQIEGRPNVRERAGVGEWVERIKRRWPQIESARVGIDVLTPTIYEALRESLPNAEIVDGYPTLLEAKLIKTEDEIACLKIATALTEAGHQAALDILKPGVRECEVLAAAWHKMTALGSEWTQCANIVASGPYTAPYRRLTSDRIIRRGDLVIMDIGGCFNGYWGDLTRTWICGDVGPTERQVELHQKAYDALFDSCAAATPGNTNVDVFEAAGDAVLGNSLGHGAGVAPWEPPYFSAQSSADPVELRPGMVMNLEPYAGEPGIGGFRVENNLVVRPDGPEIYTTFPFEKRLLDKIHPLDTTTART